MKRLAMTTFRSCALMPLLIFAAAATGCLREEPFEDELVFRTDISEILMAAEGEKVLDPDESYRTKIYDTILVSCNRNFSSKIEPAVDWVSLENEGEVNLSGKTRQTPVVLVFARNRTQTPRSADLVLFSEGKSLRIPITQAAPEYFFEAKASKQEVISMRDTSFVSILSNTRWTAEIDTELSDADVTLTKTAGRDNGRIGVCFGYNFDLVQSRKAVVNIKPENVQTAFSCTITQRNGQPFIVINQEDFTSAPEDPYSVFSLTTNVDWKISLDETGFKGGKVVSLDSYLASTENPGNWESRMEGNPAEGLKLAYIADHGTDPGIDKKVKIKAEIMGGESADSITICQKGCIHLDFLDIVPGNEGLEKNYYKQHYNEKNKETWPFEDPTWEERCKDYQGCFKDERFYRFNGNEYPEQSYTVKGGYVMPLWAHPHLSVDNGGGVWYNGNGFQLGFNLKANDKIFDYIKTPAIEGLTLRKLILEPNYGTGYNTVWIREAEASEGKVPKAVEGFTEPWIYPKKGTAHKEHELQFVHIFTDSKENTSYRISFESSGCCTNIKELVLIYE